MSDQTVTFTFPPPLTGHFMVRFPMSVCMSNMPDGSTEVRQSGFVEECALCHVSWPCLTEQLARVTSERDALADIATLLHWMARRYADGRRSTAASSFNEATRTLLKLGLSLNETADGTIWARDGMGRSFDRLTEDEAAMGRDPDWWHTGPDAREQIDTLSARLEAVTAALAGLMTTWAKFQADPPTIRCVGGYPRMRVTIGMEQWAALITAMDIIAAGQTAPAADPARDGER